MGLFGDDNLKKSEALRQWLEEDIEVHVTPKQPAQINTQKNTPSVSPRSNTDMVGGHRSRQDHVVSRRPVQQVQRRTNTASPPVVQRPPRLPQTEVESASQEEKPSIAIHLTLPKLSLSKLRPSKKVVRSAGLGIAVIGLLWLGWFMTTQNVKEAQEAKVNAPKTMEETLGFVPLSPGGRGKIVEGATNPIFDAQKGFYEYREVYKNSSMTINQQPVPEKMRKNPSAILSLTNSLGAKDSFTTTLGTVYIASDEKSGAQRLVVANSYMLMFIQSTKSLSNEDWAQYIESFERV